MPCATRSAPIWVRPARRRNSGERVPEARNRHRSAASPMPRGSSVSPILVSGPKASECDRLDFRQFLGEHSRFRQRRRQSRGSHRLERGRIEECSFVTKRRRGNPRAEREIQSPWRTPCPSGCFRAAGARVRTFRSRHASGAALAAEAGEALRNCSRAAARSIAGSMAIEERVGAMLTGIRQLTKSSSQMLSPAWRRHLGKRSASTPVCQRPPRAAAWGRTRRGRLPRVRRLPCVSLLRWMKPA